MPKNPERDDPGEMADGFGALTLREALKANAERKAALARAMAQVEQGRDLEEDLDDISDLDDEPDESDDAKA